MEEYNIYPTCVRAIIILINIITFNHTYRPTLFKTLNSLCFNRFICGLFNLLNAELNPVCHLLALLGAHHILHVSRIRVKDTVDAPDCRASVC